jgi:hypothetical protein
MLSDATPTKYHSSMFSSSSSINSVANSIAFYNDSYNHNNKTIEYDDDNDDIFSDISNIFLLSTN